MKDEQAKKEQDHLSNIDKLNQENHGKIKEKDSKIGETDSKGNKELSRTKKKLEDQFKDMVQKQESNLRKLKDSHSLEVKELDKLKAKTEKDHLQTLKKSQGA